MPPSHAPWGARTTPGAQEQLGKRSVYPVLVEFGAGYLWGDLEVGGVYYVYEDASGRKRESGKEKMTLSSSATAERSGNSMITSPWPEASLSLSNLCRDKGSVIWKAPRNPSLPASRRRRS